MQQWSADIPYIMVATVGFRFGYKIKHAGRHRQTHTKSQEEQNTRLVC